MHGDRRDVLLSIIPNVRTMIQIAIRMFVSLLDKGFTTANVFSTAINYTFAHVQVLSEGIGFSSLGYNLSRLVRSGIRTQFA